LAGADFLNAVEREWRRRADELDTQLMTAREPESLRDARAQLVSAATALRGSEQQAEENSDTLEWIGQQIKNLQGETSDEQLDAWFRKKFPPDRFCGQPLSAAIEWDCPLARGRTLPIEKKSSDVPAKQTLEQLNARVKTESLRLNKAQEIVRQRKREFDAANGRLQTQTKLFDQSRASLSDQASDCRAIAIEAKRAYDDQTQADKLEALLGELDQKIRQSQDRQGVIREQQNAALSDFSQTFGRVARAILGDDVAGSIHFRGRQMRPKLVHDIDLSSAALETLKIICFDLSALISAVEGRGGLPRFLIHDGPREADMDAELYQRLFLLMRELETTFQGRPLSFQYLITTTEFPPPELQAEPWLISPVLDATTRAGKLLGEDF
jgi:hypothetical protein